MKLSNKELAALYGGISASLITAVVGAFKAIFDFGRKIGSTLRRGQTRNYCIK